MRLLYFIELAQVAIRGFGVLVLNWPDFMVRDFEDFESREWVGEESEIRGYWFGGGDESVEGKV